MTAQAGAVSARAVAAFAEEIKGGDYRFPSLGLDELLLSSDYAALPIYLFDEDYSHLRADDHFVSIHAERMAGRIFQGDRLLFQIGMEPIPGTRIAATSWKDGSFSLGYRLSPESERRSEDARLILMHRCFVALAQAAERYTRFKQQFDMSQDRIFGDGHIAD